MATPVILAPRWKRWDQAYQVLPPGGYAAWPGDQNNAIIIGRQVYDWGRRIDANGDVTYLNSVVVTDAWWPWKWPCADGGVIYGLSEYGIGTYDAASDAWTAVPGFSDYWGVYYDYNQAVVRGGLVWQVEFGGGRLTSMDLGSGTHAVLYHGMPAAWAPHAGYITYVPLTSLGQQVWALGVRGTGGSGYPTLSAVQVYDIPSGQWIQPPAPPGEIFIFGWNAVVDPDGLGFTVTVLLGGAAPYVPGVLRYRFDDIADPTNGQWYQIELPPAPYSPAPAPAGTYGEAQAAYSIGAVQFLRYYNNYANVYEFFTTPTQPPYLRMAQRDDGLGVARHPRLAAPSNGPSSVQSTRSARIGTVNRYS